MILLRLVGLLLDVLFLPLRALRRAFAVKPGSFVVLTIDGPVADVIPRRRFWERREDKSTSLHALSELVDAMLVDPRVRGLIVTIKRLDAGMATATSLRAQLARAKKGGKEVVVVLPMGGATKEVLVASAASRVIVGPSATLAPVGFVTTSRYVKRALDRAGVEAEVFAQGEYKSAGETLVRDDMSGPQREQLGRLLDGFHEALVAAIAEGRGVSRERAAELVDGAPYHGSAAVEAGLADDAAHEDEVAGLLGLDAATGGGPRARGRGPRVHMPLAVDAGAYLAMVRRPLLRPLVRPPLVYVIPVHGAIAHADGPFSRLATDERVTRMVRLARVSPRVKGVILHVDSPGGSALASDRMHHEIVQLAREKPVVACMANVAASGGYYVAAPAHRIVCAPTTVTGSIGVIAARFSAEPLLERLGITTQTVQRGARAGLLSMGRKTTDDERAAMERELESTYKTFLSVVAEGRKMSEAEVDKLARGRVYGGDDARDKGLVDSVGGFDGALADLRAMLPSHVAAKTKVEVARSPRRALPTLAPPADGEAGRRALSAIAHALLPPRERALVELAASGERVLAFWPSTVEG
jgi:protease IV